MAYINATPPFTFPIFDGKTYFSDDEYKQLEVLFAPLFPADHSQGIPGAIDAKAVRFLSQLLALDEVEYYQIPEWRMAYRKGLELLDVAARAALGKKLINLSFDDAKQFLEKLEQGRLEDLPEDFKQYQFFRMLLEHCLQGCFSDPRWGGNADSIMWRWLGWVQPAEDIQFN